MRPGHASAPRPAELRTRPPSGPVRSPGHPLKCPPNLTAGSEEEGGCPPREADRTTNHARLQNCLVLLPGGHTYCLAVSLRHDLSWHQPKKI